MKVCLNCGAVGDGPVCDYCRTPFVEDEPQILNAAVNNTYVPVAVPMTPVPMPAPQYVVMPPQQVVSSKNRLVALLLAIFLGCFGAHRFYVGKTGTGFIWLLTIGCYGVGWIFDIVMLALGRFEDKHGRRLT
jgi:restriction system protein